MASGAWPGAAASTVYGIRVAVPGRWRCPLRRHLARATGLVPQRLLGLPDGRPAEPAVMAAFLRPPLYNTSYADAFGTLYTAACRPALSTVDYVWPGSTWRRDW